MRPRGGAAARSPLRARAAPMLSLQSPSSARWLGQVDAHLDDILVDHAHCEKKAAGVAMNLLFSYVDHVALARAMTEIVNEELEHFRMVLDLLERRGIPFRKLSPSTYGSRLHALIRREEPGKAIDRLLVAGLIEARSCERFALLGDHVTDPELRPRRPRSWSKVIRFRGCTAEPPKAPSWIIPPPRPAACPATS